MTEQVNSRNKSPYFGKLFQCPSEEIKSMIKDKVLSTSGKRMWNLESNIHKDLEKIHIFTNGPLKIINPYLEPQDEKGSPFDKNLADTLFQPKTSRQMVQEISRKINEKNKFNELQNYFKKIQNDKLPKIKNEEVPKIKKASKAKTGRQGESPKKGSQNFIFSGVTREKRNKIQDPESCSPPIGHYKPVYKLIHYSSTSNIKFIKPREEPSLKLDKESEKEFKNINKMLKDTIEGQDQQEEEQK